ncbi:T9SS type A sorting domain-containing protein [candidate division KSB1 bacterium]|nr:T9SS type A sorting domain-containing protein [candidate division KSB1 bacterium]
MYYKRINIFGAKLIHYAVDSSVFARSIFCLLVCWLLIDSTFLAAQTTWIKHQDPVLDVGSAASWDELAVSVNSVVFDGTTYHMWYSGFDAAHGRIGYATSLDGVLWEKHPNNPVIDVGYAGEWDELWTVGASVIYQDQRFKMWYTGADSSTCRIGYAESVDGVVWEKSPLNPVLDVGDSTDFDAQSVAWPTVIYSDNEYKLIYHGKNRGLEQLGFAVSDDGLTWTKSAFNPVLIVRKGDVWQDINLTPRPLLYDGQNYRLFYRDYDDEGLLSVKYASSKDCLHWTKYNGAPLITSGAQNYWDAYIIATPVILFDGIMYRMWYNGYDGTTETVGYATALDSAAVWQNHLVCASSGTNTAVLTFGQALSATDDIDLFLGEIELPPVPPPGVFDARFQLPGTPSLFSTKDYRSDVSDSTRWLLKIQAEPADFPISISWDSLAFPEGDFYFSDAIDGTIIHVDMKSQSSVLLTEEYCTMHTFKIQKMDVRSVSVKWSTGWNLVSVPVRTEFKTTHALFPDALSEAYYHDDGYQVADELEPGLGYWLKFGAADKIDMSGLKVKERNITVQRGWNIIGPFETDVHVSEITSMPVGIVQSPFFGFVSGYRIDTLLQSGSGYWLKASQDGMLHLPEHRGFDKKSVALNINHFLQNMVRLYIEDNNNKQAILYLSRHELEHDYDLPPVPPQGVFDVRFEKNRYVESLQEPELQISLQAAEFPITLRTERLHDHKLLIQNKLNAESFSKELSDHQPVILGEPVNRLALKVLGTTLLPSNYELQQNFPNPFNPTTTIRYAVPEETDVKITLYNALGGMVTTLVDRRMPAGYHSVEWNASSFSSGLYFYTLETAQFKDIKKMIVLK